MQVEELEQLVKLVSASNVGELTLRRGEARITIRKPVRRSAPMSDFVESPLETEVCETELSYAESSDTTASNLVEITASYVGFFHHAKQPVTPEDTVKAGQLLGIIEAMQLKHEVRTEVEGYVRDVTIEEGMPVEYGQTLFILEPLA